MEFTNADIRQPIAKRNGSGKWHKGQYPLRVV